MSQYGTPSEVNEALSPSHGLIPSLQVDIVASRPVASRKMGAEALNWCGIEALVPVREAFDRGAWRPRLGGLDQAGVDMTSFYQNCPFLSTCRIMQDAMFGPRSWTMLWEIRKECLVNHVDNIKGFQDHLWWSWSLPIFWWGFQTQPTLLLLSNLKICMEVWILNPNHA